MQRVVSASGMCLAHSSLCWLPTRLCAHPMRTSQQGRVCREAGAKRRPAATGGGCPGICARRHARPARCRGSTHLPQRQQLVLCIRPHAGLRATTEGRGQAEGAADGGLQSGASSAAVNRPGPRRQQRRKCRRRCVWWGATRRARGGLGRYGAVGWGRGALRGAAKAHGRGEGGAGGRAARAPQGAARASLPILADMAGHRGAAAMRGGLWEAPPAPLKARPAPCGP